VAGILLSLHIYFSADLAVQYADDAVLLFGGVGLIVRSLRPSSAAGEENQ